MTKYLTDQQIYDGSKAVLNFLQESDSRRVIFSIPTPKQLEMNDVLDKYNLSMIGFTNIVNEQLNLNYQIPDNDGRYRTFFTEKAIGFYKQIIRNYKLKYLIT